MPTIKFIYEGKEYTREVSRNFRGWWSMFSKGREYWFRKDPYIPENHGYHLINGTEIPPEFLSLIASELKKLDGKA